MAEYKDEEQEDFYFTKQTPINDCRPQSYKYSNNNMTVESLSKNNNGNKILMMPAINTADFVSQEVHIKIDKLAPTNDKSSGGFVFGVIMALDTGKWMKAIYCTNTGSLTSYYPGGKGGPLFESPNGKRQRVRIPSAAVGDVMSARIDKDDNVTFGINGKTKTTGVFANKKIPKGVKATAYFYFDSPFVGNKVTVTSKKQDQIGLDQIGSNESIDEGHGISSQNADYYMMMNKDGDLVVYKKSVEVTNAIWSTKTKGQGKGPYKCVMQSDNNLVVYDGEHKLLFSSNTAGVGAAGARCTMQDNGNLVVQDGDDKVIWASNSAQK
eukprot:283438_1